jgi:hypothetical protein
VLLGELDELVLVLADDGLAARQVSRVFMQRAQ